MTKIKFEKSSSEIFNQPVGLFTLFFTELWERFSFYGMRAILVLYLVSDSHLQNPGLGWSNSDAIWLYGWYTALVYLACIPGGIIADKYLTNKKAVSVGGALLCLGHLSLALKTYFFFYFGLSLIILGVGLLKPSISSLVGSLYEKNDLRRDQGFTIFYIGINIGAFFASILVGYVGENFGWHYGFSLAGFGMIIGQICFLTGHKNIKDNKQKNFNLNFDIKFSKVETDRIKLIILASFILIIFWASFEQAGGLLNLYAYQKTDRFISYLNFEVPASWFQSINPLLIIILGFTISSFWLNVQKTNQSLSMIKMSVGIIIMGFGFLFMALASNEADIFGKSQMYWLVLAYLFHTVGELCASPVALSFITKLSPKQFVASVMGIYFAAIGIGNKIAGLIGQYSEKLGEKTIFISITLVCTFVGAIVIYFQKRLNKLAHGADK
ncbi:peptide MFS transporter [Alphaproteobacteria bacterium]|nr:peptide MFS transporter [Alphaproteobacteria bacterium]